MVVKDGVLEQDGVAVEDGVAERGGATWMDASESKNKNFKMFEFYHLS
jgi:hypothetical protein